MATLHLVRSSAFEKSDLSQCLSVLSKYDGLVLLDDGCYNIRHALMSEFMALLNNQNLFVIEHHFVARGLTLNNNAIQAITPKQLIELTLNFDKTITWQ